MARSVHQINISGWSATGQNVPVPQYEVTIWVSWTDDAGVDHQGQRTVQFPNCLNEFSLPEQRELAEELMIRATRKSLGVD